MPSSKILLSSSIARRLLIAGCLTAMAALGRQTGIAQGAGSNTAPHSVVSQGTLPTISAEALDKTDIRLPAQLEGKLNLLLLSWARDQTAQVETWTAVGQALQHMYFDVKVYRMPVSSPENAIYRWWDNASLRAEQTDPDLLHCTVPLYTNKAALRRALGVATKSGAVLAVLVDKSGRVLWKSQGSSTAASRASLSAAVRALH